MNGISSECLNIEAKQTEIVKNCEKIADNEPEREVRESERRGIERVR
jgi:hypothetical protein